MKRTPFQLLGAVLVLLLLAGCGEISDVMDQLPTPQKREAEARARKARQDKQRQRYHELLREAIAAIAPFDREATKKEMIKEQFGLDIDEAYPNGFNPEEMLTREDVKALAQRQLKERINARFPPEKRRQVVEQAELEYPLLRVGDEVELRLHGRKIAGTISEIKGGYFKLKDIHREVAYPIDDVQEPPSVCFDPEGVKKRREAYVNRHFDMERADYIKRIYKPVVNEAFRQSNYQHVDGRWKRIDELIQEKVEPKLESAEDKYYARKKEEAKAWVLQKLSEEGLAIAPEDFAAVVGGAAPGGASEGSDEGEPEPEGETGT